jgi:Lar family restriction alleviation protein
MELKPCPFCGGEAEVINTMFYKDKGRRVKCKKCFAVCTFFLIDHPRLTPNGLDESTRYTEEQATQKAVEAWNRRVTDG